jgi:hypothetical protein
MGRAMWIAFAGTGTRETKARFPPLEAILRATANVRLGAYPAEAVQDAE